MGRGDPEVILDTAIQAVGCTIPGEWKGSLEARCLSPGELDAVLLVSAAVFEIGRKEEAWLLWQKVWDYPRQHCWREHVMAMALPQAAVVGIRMASALTWHGEFASGRDITMDGMAAKGREALELLRRNGCHCYALPLLDCLCGLDASSFGEPKYWNQINAFRKMFLDIYEWFDCPGYRIWQGISVDNTRDAGMTLKMLRTFYGKSRENAVYELVMTPRQLERIEKGLHKPSYQNYEKLVKQYGKSGEWNMPLLETDSLEVLEQRQLISTLMEHEKWDMAEWEIGKFRHAVTPDLASEMANGYTSGNAPTMSDYKNFANDKYNANCVYTTPPSLLTVSNAIIDNKPIMGYWESGSGANFSTHAILITGYSYLGAFPPEDYYIVKNPWYTYTQWISVTDPNSVVYVNGTRTWNLKSVVY